MVILYQKTFKCGYKDFLYWKSRLIKRGKVVHKNVSQGFYKVKSSNKIKFKVRCRRTYVVESLLPKPLRVSLSCIAGWTTQECRCWILDVPAINFLNSWRVRRKDGVFLWDVEELTFLKMRTSTPINVMKYMCLCCFLLCKSLL